MADRDTEKGPDEAKSLGSRALFVEIDAMDEESVKNGIRTGADHFGGCVRSSSFS